MNFAEGADGRGKQPVYFYIKQDKAEYSKMSVPPMRLSEKFRMSSNISCNKMLIF